MVINDRDIVFRIEYHSYVELIIGKMNNGVIFVSYVKKSGNYLVEVD